MNLQQIKDKYGVTGKLNLNTATDEAGVKTEWMRHWDNESRIAISLHKDLVTQLQATPKMDNLGIQEETRTGEKGEYKAVRIVGYTPAEITL